MKTELSSLTILSLGAGVQSSTLALMAASGEVGPMPHAAVFADTQAEPSAVYDWLDWLSGQLPFPVHRVTAGDLAKSSLGVKVSEAGNKYINHTIPAFMGNDDGMKGILRRSCTVDFKIVPITREVARLRRVAGGKPLPHVNQWIGISLDEIRRCKPARVSYITHQWPLVERRMTRRDCLEWMRKRGYPAPPRSSCIFCPYHSDAEWQRLRTSDPQAFARAVDYEAQLQASCRSVILRGVPYLHASRVPLSEVNFDAPAPAPDSGQMELWQGECEGMCGV